MQQESEYLQAGDSGKLFYTKTFQNGDKVLIQITSLSGFTNGSFQYFNENGTPGKQLLYNISPNGNYFYTY